MPTYRFQTSVPAPLEQVYEHITGFTDGGPANLRSLAEKHGELLEQEGEIYVFKGTSEDDGDLDPLEARNRSPGGNQEGGFALDKVFRGKAEYKC